MPCYDAVGAIETERALQERRALARIACEALRALEAHSPDLRELGPEALRWWRSHKEFDRENGR